jgi:hypothetical protein
LRLDERFVVVGAEPVSSNETGTARGLLAIPGETIEICPIYVPVCKPEAATVAINVEGMVPFVGVTESHVPPLADALNVTDGREAIVSPRLCDGGPAGYENDKLLGDVPSIGQHDVMVKEPATDWIPSEF